MSDHSRFAYELNKLILGTSLSPEDIVVELNRRSFPLPMRTFSYWLQGYFLPRSEAAFQLVAILENILKVSDNRLSDALLEDLSSGASFVPGEFAEVDFAGTPPPTVRFPATFNETVDWEANLIQKVVRDEVYLSADHKSARFKATILARVPSVPNPTFFFQLLYKDGIEPGREEIFYDLAGVTVKAKNIVEEGDVTVCSVEFALPDDVVPGDLHRFSYSWDEKSRKPMDRIGDRFVPWTLDYYSCSATFEGGVPKGTRFVSGEVIDGEDVEVPNNIPVIREGNTLSVSMKNYGNIAGWFEVPPPTT